MMVSRWTPATRSVVRMEEPSVSSLRQSSALSMSRRMAPRGRSGMMPNVFRQALHFRRGLPSLSRPHPTVGPPQVRQGVGAGVDGVSVTMAQLYPMDIHRVKGVWTQKDIHGIFLGHE
jgi:hypothetical protein